MTTFPSDERPGISVFRKNESGQVFHTYSSYGRGLDILIGAYNLLDIAPKGRDEDGLKYGHGLGPPPRPLRRRRRRYKSVIPAAQIRLMLRLGENVALRNRGVDHEALWLSGLAEHLESARARPYLKMPLDFEWSI